MDEITKDVLLKLSVRYPKAAIRLTHQFLDGEEGKRCGFVPNDFGGVVFCVTGKWWENK